MAIRTPLKLDSTNLKEMSSTDTGNGSTDGTFVYTGFRPAWVMLKKTNASGTIWQIFDSVRNTSNPVDNYVAPNSGGCLLYTSPSPRD